MEDDVAAFAQTFQRFTEQMAQAAMREQTSPVRDLLDAHLGGDSSQLPVVAETFMAFDHVNLQVAVDAYLAGDGRSFDLHGLIGQARHFETLSDIVQQSRWGGVGIGSVDLVNLPIGPDETKACIAFGIYLLDDRGIRMAMLMRGADERSGREGVALEILGADQEAARALLAEVRRLIAELNVFRGQVLAFGESPMGHVRIGPIAFLRRPELSRERLILPDASLAMIEREVFDVATHRERLRASGQHVKRGVLLWGPPGTGKTHTVRYLLSRLSDHTAFVLTGGGLGMIRWACGLARMLQPALVILEDVDLVAEHRGMSYGMGGNPLLFEVLNEMDGIAEDADVAFVLTTNRADILEPALAARPGRVDLAVRIELPDASARRRLVELYGEGLKLRLERLDEIVGRTEGVTASFIKELMRKAALLAASRSDGEGPIETSDADVAAALDELLAERSELTRVLLGAAPSGVAPGDTAWLEGPG
jgi:hypothetical protein